MISPLAGGLSPGRHDDFSPKTHVRNLDAKLGTHRWAEAVARARALGLLAPSAHRIMSMR